MPTLKLARCLLVLACTAALSPLHAAEFPTLDRAAPIVIGHRGASGYLPEHTLESYRAAIAMGADFIEPDLVSTKDGVLIARHEPVLGGTTNVASLSKFAARKRKAKIDGIEYDDWFASDFTLAEIKELRARERVASRNKRFDNAFEIPTFQDVIDLAKKESARTGRTIGIYPETKHPTWHQELNLPLERKLVDTLVAAGWTRKTDPVVIQSFEVANLKQLRGMTSVRLVQLLSCYDNDLKTGNCIYMPNDVDSAPWDFIKSGDRRTYADLITPAGLAEIKTYADGVGPWKRQFIGVKAIAFNADGSPRDVNGDGSVNEADGVSRSNSNLVSDAHAAGLIVHPYTIRTDWPFARDYAGGTGRVGSASAEYQQLFAAGVDGLFSDFPDDAVAARAAYAGDVTYVLEYASDTGAIAGPTRYYRTASGDDVARLANAPGARVNRTGDVFKAWSRASARADLRPVCRYYDPSTVRHVYSIDAARCSTFAAQLPLVSEGTAFYAVPAVNSTCPAGTMPITQWTATVNGTAYERYSADASAAQAPYASATVAFCGAP
jgi:glycerophosphoryl diester phosphodiesterase